MARTAGEAGQKPKTFQVAEKLLGSLEETAVLFRVLSVGGYHNDALEERVELCGHSKSQVLLVLSVANGPNSVQPVFNYFPRSKNKSHSQA